MSNWPTRDQQLERYYKVKKLQAEGTRPSQIMREAHVSWATYCRYRDSNKPPNPRGVNITDAAKQPRLRSGPGEGVRRYSSVPTHIARLRDEIVSAFMAGNDKLHAKLTRELEAALVAYKTANKFFKSVPVDPGSVVIAPLAGTLEAAE